MMTTLALPLPALANAFYWAAGVIGLPSVSGLILYLAYFVHGRLATPGSSFGEVKNPDAILMILGGMSAVMESIAKVFSFFGRYVMMGVVILSVVGALLAVSFWLTGRGLHAHQVWARGAAGVVVGFLTLLSFLAFVAIGGAPRLLTAAMTTAGIIAFMTIWRGFPVAP